MTLAMANRTIAKSLSLPVILTLSLPKGKNPTLSAETLRSAQGDMKATLQSSCYGELTVFCFHLQWCAAEFLVVAAAGLDVPGRLHLAVAQADETVPAAYHSVLLGWNQQ